MNKEKEIPSVLIVDDDKNTRDGLERALRGTHTVFLAENADRALGILNDHDISIVLSDVRMPGMDGLTFMQRVLAQDPNKICILLTAYGNVEMAVDAMKRGAYDFLMKPVNLDHLEMLLARAQRARDVEAENATLHKQLNDKYGLESIIGNSGPMHQLFDIIKQAAPTQATVLIHGESGTGKELVAHAIHRLSTRAKGPLVSVHCAALSPTLLESELFGHEKGAFTGAVARKSGRFEMADGGTLFLDEISEVDASVQVKLLRVLEERRFERVGGTEPVEVDIRLVVATNKNLKDLVAQGKFREDLFFRLDVVNIELPPLRERLDDMPLLCSHFVNEFSRKNGKDVTVITPDAVDVLSLHKWPGNVRELRNTIEKMVVLAHSQRLTARDIPLNIRESVRLANPGRPGLAEGSGHKGDVVRMGESLSDTERRMIFATLKKHGENRTEAAKELGISRRTLLRRLKEYGTN